MTEKKESISKLTILKHEGYKDMKVLISQFGIDKTREKDFNKMKKIEVTEEELSKLGKRDWLDG